MQNQRSFENVVSCPSITRLGSHNRLSIMKIPAESFVQSAKCKSASMQSPKFVCKKLPLLLLCKPSASQFCAFSFRISRPVCPSLLSCPVLSCPVRVCLSAHAKDQATQIQSTKRKAQSAKCKSANTNVRKKVAFQLLVATHAESQNAKEVLLFARLSSLPLLASSFFSSVRLRFFFSVFVVASSFFVRSSSCACWLFAWLCALCLWFFCPVVPPSLVLRRSFQTTTQPCIHIRRDRVSEKANFVLSLSV
jgi:hypothetical protein